VNTLVTRMPRCSGLPRRAAAASSALVADGSDDLEVDGEWTHEDGICVVLPGSAYIIYDLESVQAAWATSFYDSALEQGRGPARIEP